MGELHREVRSIFQRLLEECVERHGASVSDFYRMVASDQARSTELYSGHTFAAVINSTMSFESFYELMRDAKRGDFYWPCRCCRTWTRWSFCSSFSLRRLR